MDSEWYKLANKNSAHVVILKMLTEFPTYKLHTKTSMKKGINKIKMMLEEASVD